MNEEVVVESEAKPRKKRAIEENDSNMKGSDNSQAKMRTKKINDHRVSRKFCTVGVNKKAISK